MKARHIFVIVRIATLLLFLASAAAADEDTFRCGSNVVSIGDSKYQVLAKCGKPSYKEVRHEKRIKRDLYRDLFPPPGQREQEKYREPFLVEEYVTIEEWTYNRGSNSLIATLTFENGRLANVETDGYGF